MILRTTVRDCLSINWALPHDTLPPPPATLRYERHRSPDGEVAFVSALLFRQVQLRNLALPMVHASYPQLSLRLYVLDDESVPGVLFQSLLVPRWVVPFSRVLARQPAAAARLRYPALSSAVENGFGEWHADRSRSLVARAFLGQSTPSPVPSLGSFESTVDYFRLRRRGYSCSASGRLQRIETEHPPVAAVPARIEVLEDGLLGQLLPLSEERRWPPPHSAWFCPEMPLSFVLGELKALPAAHRVPAPG